jgi:hypothetical protein
MRTGHPPTKASPKFEKSSRRFLASADGRCDRGTQFGLFTTQFATPRPSTEQPLLLPSVRCGAMEEVSSATYHFSVISVCQEIQIRLPRLSGAASISTDMVTTSARPAASRGPVTDGASLHGVDLLFTGHAPCLRSDRRADNDKIGQREHFRQLVRAEDVAMFGSLEDNCGRRRQTTTFIPNALASIAT